VKPSIGSLLECRDVKRHYGALAAVDGIDLKVAVGETIGIGGPNGAGKTTFFDLISGLTAVNSGQVLFNGKSIRGVPAHKLFHMGMARTFQVTDGFGSMTVLQNMMVSVVYGNLNDKAGFRLLKSHRAKSMALLDEYGLTHLCNSYVADIPSLDRKKLMVATAVVNDPQILLLDEPVGGLAPSEIDEFIELMFRLRKKGMSIVFIEHVMRFLTTVADRALIMHQGKLIFDGAPKEIVRDETVRRVYLGSQADALAGCS
jgi:branched-chain amino acid transport system ATP-binding protein